MCVSVERRMRVQKRMSEIEINSILCMAYPFYIKEIFSVGDPDGYEISLYPLHNGVYQDNYEVYQH